MGWRLAAAVSLMGRTLPYAIVRFGILLVFSVVTIIWFALTIGGLVVAALLASNVRQAFLKPLFLLMVMTKCHAAVRNQPIDLEWDDRLSGLSGKFREIKDKPAGGWTGAAPPVPGSPAA